MTGLPPAVAGVCPEPGPAVPPALVGATQVRLTYLDTETGELRCDVVIPIGAEPPLVAVPSPEAPADVIVEYLDAAGALLGRGAVDMVDLESGAVVDVTVAPAGAFACARDRSGAPRAFHSATPLPGGDVLLLGGLAGPGGEGGVDPAAGFFLQPRVEIYDPGTGAVTAVAVPGLTPRAFHQAYVVDTSEDGATIAVLGGLTVNGDPAATPVAVVGGALRLAPAPAAIGARGELLRYDRSTRTFTVETLAPADDVAPRAFAALPTPRAAAIAHAGGLDLAQPGAPPQASVDRVDPATGRRTAQVGMARPRVGATVTALSAAELLVWGGDPAAGNPKIPATLGEWLTSWQTAPAVAPLVLAAGSEGGPHRAFHAAARAGDGSVILAGGFRIELGAALAVATPPVQRVTLAGGEVTLATLGDPVAVAPAGYLAAVTTGEGDVLFAGGNPDPAAAGCVGDAMGLVCAIGDAWRFDPATATLSAAGGLGVPRYGHALTLLDDGTVLASGGLTVRDGELGAVVDLELFEPRDAGDDPLGRAPGAVASACPTVP